MRKIASLLAFILTVQFSTYTYAGDPVAEIKQFQACLNEKSILFAKKIIELQPDAVVMVDSDARLGLGKMIFETFVIQYFLEKNHAERKLSTSTKATVISIIFSMLTQLGESNVGKKLNTMKNFYEGVKFNGPALAEAGGEDILLFQIKSLEGIKKSMAGLKWTSLGITVLIGLATFLLYDAIQKDEISFKESASTLDEIYNADSEVDFYKGMRSSDEWVTKVRKFSLARCSLITKDLIDSFFDEIQKSKDEEINQTQHDIQAALLKPVKSNLN